MNVHEALEIGKLQLEEFAQQSFRVDFTRLLKREWRPCITWRSPLSSTASQLMTLKLFFSSTDCGSAEECWLSGSLQVWAKSCTTIISWWVYCCLRKGDKSILVRRLAVPQKNPSSANIALIDGSQLLYHIVWPVSGTGKVEDIVNSMKAKVLTQHRRAETFIIFDQYQGISAKDLESQRRAGEVSTEHQAIKQH